MNFILSKRYCFNKSGCRAKDNIFMGAGNDASNAV